jgi:SAM-dependent methyltransferase
MSEQTSCPVCGDVALPYRHAWLRRCEVCGVLSSTDVVAIDGESSAGPIDESARAIGLNTLRRRNNDRLLAALSRLQPRGDTLLDVGSGPGFLLAQASAKGFRAEGIEPDAGTVGAARHGYFPDVLAPGETFDVIVFNDVLEHIPDLAGALEASWRHLSPGGVLCLNCPDMRGLFYRVASALDRIGVQGPYNRLWQRGLPSPHVWYFTPELLGLATRRIGFEPLAALRLETIELSGLWSRIRADRGTGLGVALASLAFSVAMYPVSRLLPSDATACFFRKPA